MGWLDELRGSRGELESLSRSRAHNSYCGSGVCLCRLLGRFPCYVASEDVSLACHLLMDGFWESWVTLALARLIQPRWRCVDVGANFGYYTTLFADLVGKEGFVYAFEPIKKTFDLLERTIAANGSAGTVRLIRSALADKEADSATMIRAPFALGSATLRETNAPIEWRTVYENVDISTLDLSSVEPPVNLLKIDAEGLDYHVIRGAEQLIKQSPSIFIVFEHNNQFYEDPEKELRSITWAGWRLLHIDYEGDAVPISHKRILADPDRLWNLALERNPS